MGPGVDLGSAPVQGEVGVMTLLLADRVAAVHEGEGTGRAEDGPGPLHPWGVHDPPLGQFREEGAPPGPGRLKRAAVVRHDPP